MAVTGTNSENQDMRLLAKELVVNGVPVTGGGSSPAWGDIADKPFGSLVSPTNDYADLTEATAAIKSIIDALKS